MLVLSTFRSFECIYRSFAVIDIIGSIPIILNLKQKRKKCEC